MDKAVQSPQAAGKPDYTVPFITMVTLFFIVGFLTVVNQNLQVPLQEAFQLSFTETTLVTFAFFLGYPVMGTPGAKMVDKFGYKTTLVIALLILTGALGVFTLAAKLVSFPVFLLASFICGSALSVLQVVINPYVSALGEPETAATRLNIAGGVNSLGTVLAPLFVTYVVFGGKEMTVDAIIVPYVVLAITVLMLAMVVWKLSLPEIGQGETEEKEELTGSAWDFRQLKLGVVGIFCYVGVEVAVGANLNLYVSDLGLSGEFGSQMTSLYWGGLMVGRFISGFGLKHVRANTQLTVAALANVILVVLAMLVGGKSSIYLLVLMGLFHSIMWGCIFTLAINGLGAYTAQGSGHLMIGVFGGAVLPLVQGLLADAIGGFRWTFLIVLIGELYILFYGMDGYKPKHKIK